MPFITLVPLSSCCKRQFLLEINKVSINLSFLCAICRLVFITTILEEKTLTQSTDKFMNIDFFLLYLIGIWKKLNKD